MIPVEVCVHSQDDSYVSRSVLSVWQGGADRIELCSHMEQDGLTPSIRHIELARDAFKDRPGLLAMIRPVGGGFFYAMDQIALMEHQIRDAAMAGVDGIVIGVLDKKTAVIHRAYCEKLIGKAREFDLTVTFHRAFDATPDCEYSLETLLELGVDRVLTSGTAWGSSQSALEGLEQLETMGRFVSGGLEIVVGGGVSMSNASTIISALKPEVRRFSLHTYSAVMDHGNVSSLKVRQMKSLMLPT